MTKFGIWELKEISWAGRVFSTPGRGKGILIAQAKQWYARSQLDNA